MRTVRSRAVLPLPLAALLLVTVAGGSARADDASLQRAGEAFQKGDWAAARDLARKADPSLGAKRWRLIGSSSCNLKDRNGALEAASNLTGDDVQFVRFACNRHGLELADEDIAVWRSPARLQVHEAQSAYEQARYAEAKKLAQAALQADPKLAKAWRLLGASSCWTKDKRTAQQASDHLQPVDQEWLRAHCARTLGGGLKSRSVR